MSLTSPQPTPASAARAGPETPAATAPSLPRWQSSQLFGGRNEVVIEHGGALYRLRITSLGKLILTK